MPSTYSPNLKIELIPNGEQDGTWGSTTNTNFGTALEESIVGSVDVSFASADVTLGFANSNAAQPFRNLRLRLVGTTGGARNLIVPNIEKLYYIKNDAADTVTIKTAAGSGVAVPSGKAGVVYVDGVDVVEAITQLNTLEVQTLTASGLTAVSPAFTGTPTAPTASPGTNTTQIATTAFATLALQAVYPVGSIYINATNATNPGTLFGFGTWTAFGAGRTLIGAGGGFTGGATGGSADAVVASHSHTATSSVTDSGHSHVGRVATTLGGAQGYDGFEEGRGNPDWSTQTSTNSATTGISVSTTVDTAGVSATNANLPPYIVVYMWTRTA